MSANNQYIPFDNEDNGISGFHITASDYGMHLLDKVSTTVLADEVYIRRQMKYIFNRVCSIYSTAYAVYIHFSGLYIGCGRTFILSYLHQKGWQV